MLPRQPSSTLFPYTTLFRSLGDDREVHERRRVARLHLERLREKLLGLVHGFLLEEERREVRSEDHTSELQSHVNLVCRLLLEKKKKRKNNKSINIRKNEKN